VGRGSEKHVVFHEGKQAGGHGAGERQNSLAQEVAKAKPSKVGSPTMEGKR